jgi:hypothetical protein
VFGFLVAVASVLLMAPQTNEFGTKVALLGGLAVVCAGRPILEWITSRRDTRVTMPPAGALAAVAAVALPLLGVAVVAAGAPARGVVVASAEDVLGRAPLDVDPATFPDITVDQDVLDWNHEISGAGAREIVLTLAENLELERRALLEADPAILEAVTHGDRLDDLRERLERAEESGTTVVEQFQIDDVNLRLIVPFGRQTGLSLGLESRGTVTTETYDGDQLQDRTAAPFAKTFVMSRPTGARWLDVAEQPVN